MPRPSLPPEIVKERRHITIKKYRDKLKTKGICVHCGHNLALYGVLCSLCKVKNAAQMEKKRREKGMRKYTKEKMEKPVMEKKIKHIVKLFHAPKIKPIPYPKIQVILLRDMKGNIIGRQEIPIKKPKEYK